MNTGDDVASKSVVWIGLAWIKGLDPAKEDPLEGGAGGYVNAVSLAESREEFERAVSSALAVWNLRTLEFQDVEPLVNRQERGKVPAFLLSLAEQCETDGRVHCGEIFVYDNEES